MTLRQLYLFSPTTTHPRDADRPGNTNVLFVASNCPVESCRLDREKGLVALGRGTGLAIRTTDYGRGIVMKGPGTLAAVGPFDPQSMRLASLRTVPALRA